MYKFAVRTLKQMAVTMGVQSSSWNLDDPCSSSANENVNITCTLTDDGVYHITEL